MAIKKHIKHILVVFVILAISFHSIAQPTVTISGYVSDAATGERLTGATVFLPEHKTGTACNDYGFFSLGVPPGKITLVFRFVGFEPLQKTLDVQNDTLLNIKLETRNIVKEVEVKATPKEDFLLSPAMGTHRLNAQQVERIPAVLGEPDLLKAIQLLPGVSFATEGSTGFSYNWQNLTTVLRWNRIFSPVLFANFSAYNSRFRQMYLNKFDKKGAIGFRAGNLSTGGKNYWSLRPRASVRYLFSGQVSGKVSWSRMKQFLHQLQNTTLGIPTELWVSSTKKIKPGTSDLFSAGVFFNPKNYQFSAETFYTAMKDVVQYREGTLAAKERGESWEDHVEQGRGTSYGLELMAEKTTGSLTGWVTYTLSKSTRQFSEINFGRMFPFTYNRRHQLNINTNWSLGEKQKKGKTITKDFSATFSYASGKYITLAEQEYQAIPLPLMEGSRYNAEWFARRSLINSVNNYQMPDFHHLNLSYRIERQNAGKSYVWNFSVYNVYNRLNPWYYYKKGDQMKQITLFPVIPSVSFTYRW